MLNSIEHDISTPHIGQNVFVFLLLFFFMGGGGGVFFFFFFFFFLTGSNKNKSQVYSISQI